MIDCKNFQLPKDSVMTDPYPLIAYRPLKHIIKLETVDEHKEVNSVEEEDWTLQVQYYIMSIKLNQMFNVTQFQLRKDSSSVTPTDNTTSVTGRFLSSSEGFYYSFLFSKPSLYSLQAFNPITKYVT